MIRVNYISLKEEHPKGDYGNILVHYINDAGLAFTEVRPIYWVLSNCKPDKTWWSYLPNLPKNNNND